MDATARHNEPGRLLDLLRERDPGALSQLLTDHGRALVGIAYAVLQARGPSERAAAAAIAECWRLPADSWPVDGDHLARALFAAAARQAVSLHGRTREVDPSSQPRAAELLELSPPRRALVALQAIGGFDEDEAADALQLGGRQRKKVLEGLSLLPAERARREQAVRENVRGLPVDLDAARVRAAMAEARPPDRPVLRRALPPTAGGLVLLLIGVLVATGQPAPAGQGPPGAPAAADEPSAAPTPRTRTAIPPTGAEPTLADCGIGPPGAELAFSGWTTPAELGVGAADLDPESSVYALVPSGDVAWNPHGRPRIMPPVRGRMACLHDPAADTFTIIGLGLGWEPPSRPVGIDTDRALAECGIRRGGALAFEGWLTRGQLVEARAGAADPLYVLVTDDTEAWSGWTRMAGPPYRPPNGRLGCSIDPASGAVSAHFLPPDWRPPELIDGCPASPMARVAGRHEIGGPEGFVLLPDPGTSWWADDPGVRILARLAPSPLLGEEVTAWAQPLGHGEQLPLRVDAPPPPQRDTRSSTYYVWLTDVEFGAAGCWVVGLAIDGRLAGSAILPVSERVGAVRPPG